MKTRMSVGKTRFYSEKRNATSGNLVSSVGPYYNISVESLLVSQGHKWPPKDGRDHGGPFEKTSAVAHSHHIPYSTYKGTLGDLKCKGNLTAYNLYVPNETLIPIASSNSQLDAYGTSGIAKAIPTNPLSGLAQFLGEAHELPKMFSPHEWKDKIRNFKSMSPRYFASNFLEYEFGWLPLISDIKAFYRASNNLNKIALQYERDSGRNIRRGRKVSSTTDTSSSILSSSWYGTCGPSASHYASTGILYKDIITTRDVWFSGCFTYYLPKLGKPGIVGEYKHYEAITNKIFGQRLTPSVLWNLTPWSWAVDWVSNAGDVIHNWSAFQNDGLVMRYGYVMEHCVTRVIYRYQGGRLIDGTSLDTFDVQTYSRKKRRAATPYGFGLNTGSFTDRQNAIIAALAIQRAGARR